jgi:hypothetical protein
MCIPIFSDWEVNILHQEATKWRKLVNHFGFPGTRPGLTRDRNGFGGKECQLSRFRGNRAHTKAEAECLLLKKAYVFCFDPGRKTALGRE